MQTSSLFDLVYGYALKTLYCADLGYESCTWENELDPIIVDPKYQSLITDFWQRHYACLERSSPSSRAEHEKLVQSGLDAVPGRERLALGFVDEPIVQPDYITAAPLEPHQRGGVAMLRRMYLGSHDAVLSDDPAMGMVATVLTFLQVRYWKII